MPSQRNLGLVNVASIFVLLSGCTGMPPLDFLTAVLPTQTSTPSPNPTATDTPEPSPAFTPLPTLPSEAELQAASAALLRGDWDQALTRYERAAEQATDSEEGGAAQLGFGLTLLRAGRPGEAREALTRFVQEHPDHSRIGQGYFLRAEANEALGEWDAAVGDYERYLQTRPGLLEALVQERVGDILSTTGRPLEAVARYEAAILAARLGRSVELATKIGRAYAEAGDYPVAVAKFDEAAALTGEAGTKATLNLLSGRALEALGDDQGAFARYLESVYSYPQAYDSYLGLITLVDNGVPVDEFQRGLVDFYAEAYEPALAAFERSLLAVPSSASYFYRGLTRRELGDLVGAVEDLQTVISAYGDDPHWTEAWFELARTQWIYLDQYPSAVETYLNFVRAAPASPSAVEGLMLAARHVRHPGGRTSGWVG